MIVADLVGGLVGFLLIQAVYIGFKSQWPNSYVSLSDTHSLKLHSRLWRVVLFRVVPVFGVMTLTWSMVHRFDGSGWIAVLIASVLHIAFSNGVALFHNLFPGEFGPTVNYGSYHIFAATIAGSGAVAASFAGPYMQPFVPSAESLIESVWTAAFVAAIVGAFLYLTKNQNGSDPNSELYLFDRAVKDMGIDVYDEIFRSSVRNSCDPLMTLAVATVEALQRPRWVRRAERFLGRFKSLGTYGVMQMSSSKPISDKESIDLFTGEQRHSVYFELNNGREAGVKHNIVWLVGGTHNGDMTFIRSITDIYGWLLGKVKWEHADDSAGAIGILSKRSYATEWGIRIATNLDTVEVGEYYESDFIEWSRPHDSKSGEWWFFEHRCTISSEWIIIRDKTSQGSPMQVDLSVVEPVFHER